MTAAHTMRCPALRPLATCGKRIAAFRAHSHQWIPGTARPQLWPGRASTARLFATDSEWSTRKVDLSSKDYWQNHYAELAREGTRVSLSLSLLLPPAVWPMGPISCALRGKEYGCIDVRSVSRSSCTTSAGQSNGVFEWFMPSEKLVSTLAELSRTFVPQVLSHPTM